MTFPGSALAAVLFAAAGTASAAVIERADILVVGGDEAACAAAVQVARMGADVMLVSDCNMLGGQYSAQGVGPIDERVKENGASVDFPRSGIALEIMRAVEAYNLGRYGRKNPGNAWSASRTIEPAAAAAIFERLVGAERIRVLKGYAVKDTLCEGDRVVGVRFSRGLEVRAGLTVDASDWGDVIRLGGVRHFVGTDPRSRFNEPGAPETVGVEEMQEMNPLTWTMTLRQNPSATPIAKPEGYETFFFEPETWEPSGVLPCTYPSDIRCNPYIQRRLVDTVNFRMKDAVETIQLNATCMDYPLCQWPEDVRTALARIAPGLDKVNFIELPSEGKEIVLADAKRRALAYLYFLQNDNPATRDLMRRFQLTDEFGTPDRLPPKPYIREGCRLAAVRMLTANEVRAKDPRRPVWAPCPSDAAFGFQFHIDFHPTRRSYPSATRTKAWRPKHSATRNWDSEANRSFFPYSAFVPESAEGLLGAGKNVGVSSIVQAALRLHPQMVLSGQCAGALAAASVGAGRSPRELVGDADAVRQLQERMVRGVNGHPGVAIWAWQDLHPGDADFIRANLPVVRARPADEGEFSFRKTGR